MSTTAAPPRIVSWEGETAWKNALGRAHSRWFAERRSRQWPNTAAPAWCPRPVTGSGSSEPSR